jgi:hypothetical protein
LIARAHECADGSADYNEASLKTAAEHVDKMKSDMGGTEILRPIQDVFTNDTNRNVPMQVGCAAVCTGAVAAQAGGHLWGQGQGLSFACKRKSRLL